MLDIFIRKPLAPWALRQPNVPSSSPLCGFLLRFIYRTSLGAILGSFGRGIGRSAPLVAAMEDVVELGNGVATFDADGHTKTLYMVEGS